MTKGHRKRIVVTGATGDVGTAVVRALGSDPDVGSIVGVARRPSRRESPRTGFVTADVARDDDHPVTGDWPTRGSPMAAYTREKSYVERVVGAFGRSHPRIRVVRLRPGFLFQKASAPEQRRLSGGPLVPGKLVRPSLIPVRSDIPQLRIQTAHTEDVADAYRRRALQNVMGAFNIAADPVLDTRSLARILSVKPVKVPAVSVGRALALAWSLHLFPVTPGLFGAVLHLPVMNCTRARKELGWTPRYSSEDAIKAFILGLREGEGLPAEPLRSDVGRAHELAIGVGERP